METEELIEHILRQKHLEEMMNRPEKEHTPLEGMDNEQIKRFALFLFEENQNKSKQLDEMIARLDEIGKDLKDANRKIDSLTDALLKANSKAEKAAIECKLRDKEYKKLEKKHNALVERLSLMNNQTYASSKSLKGIDRKKVVKGKHDDKDDFDGTPTAPAGEVPQSDSAAKNRLSDMDWNTSVQNLLNWADKGAMQLNKLIPALKKIALQDGANVNVDETWLRYHAYNKKRKTYMWCLVNRKARIVIFFYEDTTDDEGVQKHGGRSRNVLKEFLGDAKIKSLQSDGYNVYMYLDNELIDVEHLCCLAHARAKFKYAYDQGSLQARIFLELIAKLYGMEETYRREKLTSDEIYHRRNSKETTEIIDKIRTELYDLLANPDESRSELMGKALNYLKNFWNQIFAYRNDGEYSIDNMAAERAIRPITVQRKNSLFFGSVKGIQNSAIYNTFIETCKQVGVSFRDYFCRLLRELKKGRTDYENLLPMTICK